MLEPARNNPVGAKLNFTRISDRLKIPKCQNHAHRPQSPPATGASRIFKQFQGV